MLSIPTVTLNDGVAFPELGLGTYKLQGPEGVAAIVAAIDSGYRLLDTAVNYENEGEVGEAVRTAGVDRAELLITTKIPVVITDARRRWRAPRPRSRCWASTGSTSRSSTGPTPAWASTWTPGAG